MEEFTIENDGEMLNRNQKIRTKTLIIVLLFLVLMDVILHIITLVGISQFHFDDLVKKANQMSKSFDTVNELINSTNDYIPLLFDFFNNYVPRSNKFMTNIDHCMDRRGICNF